MLNLSKTSAKKPSWLRLILFLYIPYFFLALLWILILARAIGLPVSNLHDLYKITPQQIQESWDEWRTKSLSNFSGNTSLPSNG